MLDEIPVPIQDSPFPDILDGMSSGVIIARDDKLRFAIIESLHPEAAVHWLAIPFEPVPSIEVLHEQNQNRFLELLAFALREAKTRALEHPDLENGFTIKFHVGSFETIPHAKLHILSCE
jgi:histidine triad (HIT) family protein